MTQYTDNERELLELLWHKGEPAAAIAKRLGRSVRSIYLQTNKMGIKRTAEYKTAQCKKAAARANIVLARGWKPQELAALKSLSMNGYGYGDMMRAFPKRTYQGIYQKLRELKKIDAA
jgi:hypothetical protein